MDVGEFLGGKWLTHDDLPTGIDTVVCTIEEFELVEMKKENKETERRPAVKFHQFDKMLVLNKTNLKKVVKLYGSETDDWLDQKLGLYVDEDVEYKGDIVSAIRIRGRIPTDKAYRPTKPANKKRDKQASSRSAKGSAKSRRQSRNADDDDDDDDGDDD